jgi:hypothetical protein
MKRIIGISLTLTVAAALLTLFPNSKRIVPVARAQSGCSVATLSGNYGFNNPGFIAPGHSNKGAEVPFAAVGVITLDGAGNTSGTYTLAVKGGISSGNTFSGTYTVNSDCTGSTTVQGAPNSNFVILGGGAEIFGIETSPGFTGTLDAKRE